MAEQQTIIIKKIKKGGGGHHGGAWKIAYADFVTAMMAFFLLLWLLNSVTQEQLEGISNYFAPVSVSESTSGSGGMLGGQTISEGSMVSTMAPPPVSDELPEPKAAKDSSESIDEETGAPPGDADAEEQMRKKEEEQFKEAEQTLHDAIKNVPELQNLAKSLLIDNTPEGLRIQLVDQEGLPMFPSGGSDPLPHTLKLLRLVAEAIKDMPQKISISGHTDSVKFVTNNGYSNWELSADRANASRRALIHMGVAPERIARVVGKAETEPLLPDDPTNARNRRLSIVLLRQSNHNKKNGPEAAGDGLGSGLAPASETPQEPVSETPPQEEPVTETPQEPVSETPQEPVTETPQEPVSETPQEPVSETPPQEEPASEPPAQEPPAQEPPVQESPVQEPPAQEASPETPVEKDTIAPAPPRAPISSRRPKLNIIGQ